jgi:hypothetical protein
VFCRMRVFFTITASTALTIPVAAQSPAPTTTAFDGTYTGVSRTLESTMTGYSTRQCPPNGRPAPLTIMNGNARTIWGGTAEGSVNPQGVLVMHAPNGARIEGQIDPRGAVTGRLTSACSYQVVWQKKGS